jgi:hypothetical protein
MEMFTSETLSILSQLQFVAEKYPTKCLFIHASCAVVPGILIDLVLSFNAFYTQRTSRTPIIVY